MAIYNEQGQQVDIDGQPWELPVLVPTYTLNTEQQNAFDWLFSFCIGTKAGPMESGPWRKVLLQGYAGTGKSFALTKMIEAVKRKYPHINFGVTAPTHKAVRVLKKQSELREELDFGTIHSFLSLKQKRNEATGEVTYEPDYRPNGQPRRIDGVNVLIVDESSMLDDKLFEYLEDELRSNSRLRIIFVGDELQIPPVGKKDKVLHEVNAIPFVPERRISHKIHLLELIEPQRQAAGSPIIMYAHAIRQQIMNQSIQFDFKPEYEHALVKIPTGSLQSMKDLVTEYFLGDEFENNVDYCKFISYTNKTTDYFNALVREMKYGTRDTPRLLTTDKFIMEEPIVIKNSVAIAKNEDVILTSIKEENIAFKYELIEHKVFSGGGYDPLSNTDKNVRTLALKIYKVVVLNEEGKAIPGMVVHEDSLAEFESVRETIRQAAFKCTGYDRSKMWTEWYRTFNAFIWIKHNYAITAHSAQGSTYNFAISQEWDIDRLRVKIGYEEANRIRYVAATRASTKLYVVR